MDSREREPDLEIKVPVKREPCFDGLCAISPRHILVKCVEEGELTVLDMGAALVKKKSLSRSVCVAATATLQWEVTDEIYINCSAAPQLEVALCGDHKGNIWLYDVRSLNLNASSRAAASARFRMRPTKVLQWPECSVAGTGQAEQALKNSLSAEAGFRLPVVNTVQLSYNGRYICAVTDNNLVCIWRRVDDAEEALPQQQTQTMS